MQTSRSAFRLDVQGVSKNVNGHAILSKVSLSVHPGELIGLLGPSGAGKSSLLNALNGFRPADSGRVLVNGTNLYEHFDRFRIKIGYVPQDDIVHNSLNVYRSLYYAALLRFPLSPDTRSATQDMLKKRVNEVIRTLGLEEQRKTKITRLSGGQRKRVSLGIELLTSPPLLFLDEPTSGLDPGLEERMMKLFHTLAKEGRTVIITTHIMESLQLLDLVALLVKGHLVFYGPPEQALKAFKVNDFSDIYGKLERYNPASLANQFRQSSLYRKYVSARLAKRYETEAILQERQDTNKATPPAPRGKPQKPPQAQPLRKQQSRVQKAARPPETDSIDDELARLKQRLREES